MSSPLNFGITYLAARTSSYSGNKTPSDETTTTHTTLKKRVTEDSDKDMSNDEVETKITSLKKRAAEVQPEEDNTDDDKETLEAINTLMKNYTAIKPENECFLVSDLQKIVDNPSSYSAELVKAAKYYIDDPALYLATDDIITKNKGDGYISLGDLTNMKLKFEA